MITFEMLKIYQKYNGDSDAWSKMNIREEKVFSPTDWGFIDNILQDLTIVNGRFASKEFEANLQKRISENIDGFDTIKLLYELKS